MCVIIHKPANVPFDSLTPEMQREIYSRNPDGFGYMYWDEQQGLVAEKSLFRPEHIEYIISQLPEDRDVFLHWRMATSGQTTEDMAHPYEVTPNLAMMHNGVISKYNPKPSYTNYGYGLKLKESETNDTLNFISQRIKPEVRNNPYIWLDMEFIDEIEKEIGFSNKLVFMDNQGYCKIYNGESWTEYGGLKFSNTYGWPAGKYRYGGSNNTYVIGNTDNQANSHSATNNLPAPTAGDGELEVNLFDLMDADYDDIYQFCQSNPEAIADILYYDVLDGADIGAYVGQ